MAIEIIHATPGFHPEMYAAVVEHTVDKRKLAEIVCRRETGRKYPRLLDASTKVVVGPNKV